jgi:hypothetical protein
MRGQIKDLFGWRTNNDFGEKGENDDSEKLFGIW